jgi:hypothetical protein
MDMLFLPTDLDIAVVVKHVAHAEDVFVESRGMALQSWQRRYLMDHAMAGRLDARASIVSRFENYEPVENDEVPVEEYLRRRHEQGEPYG